MYYIIKLYYFVAVFRLLTRLFCQRFLKIKNVDKIKKNVKNVFYIYGTLHFSTFLSKSVTA